MSTEIFAGAYERLNTAQREAVDTIEGPVMVIAGPGTGKTQILTLRIANILKKTDAAPENILALTFTEAGARAMRERLRSYIGSRAHRVSIYTFHEFAGTLIRQYPEMYDRAVGGRPATDLEKIAIIENIIETGGIKALRPHGSPTFYIRPILSTLALLKREYITPDRLTEIIHTQEATLAATPKIHEKGAHKGKVRSEYQKLEKELGRNKELLLVYRVYDEALTDRGLFDFEDMIFETVRALEQHEDMLRDLQERYQYILADEHQDVNGSQNRILELLASFHDRPNLFVVGDEKQAIFRFQGASLENFLYFEEKFPHTKTIALTENYRSAQNILDLCHELITSVANPAAALRVPLRAATEDQGSIERRVFGHQAVEDEAVVDQIVKLIETGAPQREIAIIVRSNREVEQYAHLLRARGVPVNATADGDVLYHPITVAVRSLLTAVVEPGNEEALFRVLHAPYWDIAREDLVRLVRARNFDTPLARLLTSEEKLTELGLSNVGACLRIVSVLESTRKKMITDAPHRVLQFLLSESGMVTWVMSRDPLEGGRVLRRLYDEIESEVRSHEAVALSDILRTFTLRMEHRLPLSAPYIHTNTDAVVVTTAHKSKGLEFEHVFVPHLTDALWGDTTKPTYFKIPITKHVPDDAYDDLDDERKLLYVALSRAKRGLYLSCATASADGKVSKDTPLFDEVAITLWQEITTEDAEAAFNPLQALTASIEPLQIDRRLLMETLRDRGLSATSLNNYLRSPWNYLYRNVLRIPEMQDSSAQFGTALHNTLRSVTRHKTATGKLPDATSLKRYLEQELGKLPVTTEEFTRFHERGFAALVLYLDTVGATLPTTMREEVKLEAVLDTGIPEFPEVRLTGNLDRLDYDETGKVFRVIDYKSGKPKTRGFIEGNTKDSNGDYKRQLVFYALLLTLQDDTRLHARNGTLSFVEADESGKIHEEAYAITDEEIEQLKQEIVRVTKEVVTGEFLGMSCDPDTSDYCDLVSQLQGMHH